MSARSVAVGGGHGVARTLAALSRLAVDTTAVVTMADDGGSSGRLRRDLGVPPPGDLRMALSALATDPALNRLVEHRFSRGELEGHSLGNLMLVGLLEQNDDDLVAALDTMGAMLRIRGRVLPCTTRAVTMSARTRSGELRGQAAIAATPDIEEVRLEPPDPPMTAAVADALHDADLIVLGPGSLYTSLLANLLVPGVADAMVASGAVVAMVANLREQKGETQGMGLVDHLEALARHVPGLRIDVLIVHEGAAPTGPGEPLYADDERLAGLVGEIRRADLVDGADGHDPTALSAVFADLLDA